MSSMSLPPSQFHEQLGSDNVPLLIHVLSDEAFEEKRIPGSQHACVYEIAFIDRISKLASDKSARLAVYGLNDKFGAAALAVAKLVDAGYQNVLSLEGGLDAWEESGFEVEGAGDAASLIKDGTYPVDPSQSVFRWIGRNLFNQHNGRIAIKSGQLEMREGWLKGGEITLDMTTISCSDLKDEGMQQALIGHLKTDDFFSVAEFPEASFCLQTVEILVDIGPGDSNVKITGSLSLRGKQEELGFTAQQVFLGNKLGLQGQFDVDRTRFGSVYGSGKIFEKLGQHVVNDNISVGFQLICLL